MRRSPPPARPTAPSGDPCRAATAASTSSASRASCRSGACSGGFGSATSGASCVTGRNTLKRLPRPGVLVGTMLPPDWHLDEEHAKMMIKVYESTEQKPYSPPMSTWTTEAGLLATLVDEVISERATVGRP